MAYNKSDSEMLTPVLYAMTIPMPKIETYIQSRRGLETYTTAARVVGKR